MAQTDILKKYYKKLARESLFKSILLGVVIGFSVGALVMMLSWIANAYEWSIAFDGTVIAIVSTVAVTAGAATLFYFFAFRPTMKKAAERVDRLGFEERAITMLQMADSENPMARIQREDVQVKLDAPTAKKFKIRVPKLAIILASLFLVLNLTMLIIPNATGVFATPSQAMEEVDQSIIDGLLQDLRDEIDNSTVNQEVKDELHQMVDDLEESLKGLESTQEKIDKIVDTAEKIREKLKGQQTHEKLGEALQEHENTKELGEAIEKGDSDAVNDALDNIRDKIEDAKQSGSDAMKKELEDLADSLDQALEKAGQEGDPLSDALKDLSDQLKSAAKDAENGDTDSASQKTDDAISDAKDAIGDALGEENAESDLNDQMQGSIGDALDQLDPDGSMHEQNGSEDSNSQDGEGNKPEEDAPPSEKPGQSETEDPEKSGAPNPDDDPYGSSFKDGQTPYSEEFEKYFREEMEKLANTDATQEEKEMIARYFAAMRMKEDQAEDAEE